MKSLNHAGFDDSSPGHQETVCRKFSFSPLVPLGICQLRPVMPYLIEKCCKGTLFVFVLQL